LRFWKKILSLFCCKQNRTLTKNGGEKELEISPEEENSLILLTRDRSIQVRFDKDPVPISTIQQNILLEKILQNGGYKVKYKQGSQRVTIFRFLLAKLVYDQDGLGLDEFLILYDLYLWMDKKCSQDREFSKKYEEWLITIFDMMKSLSSCKTFPIRPNRDGREILKKFLVPLLPSSNAYFGYKKQPRISNSFRIVVRNPLLPGSVFPPKRFVGVGYRDKGHQKNTAIDGRPGWKELSAAQLGEDSPLFLPPVIRKKFCLIQ
jgi:hypothetical protein